MKLPTVTVSNRRSLPRSTLRSGVVVFAIVTATVLALTGCNTVRDFKPPKNKPSNLPVLTTPSQTLALVWKGSIGGGQTLDPLRPQLALQDDHVYAASRSGLISAWDLEGPKVWQVKTKHDITSGVSVASGILVYGTAKGHIVALDAKTGQQIWTQTTSSSLLSPALISGDRVVVLGADGSVTAKDLKTGQAAWTYDIPRPALSLRGSSAPVVFDQSTVIVAGDAGRIYGLDLLTGTPKWERRVAISNGTSEVQRLIDINGDPLISNRQLYVVSYQGQLAAMNIEDQQVSWIVDTSSVRTPTTGLGNIYVSTVDGKILAVDEQTGKTSWIQDALSHRGLSNPVVLGRYLIVGDNRGYLHIIEQTEGKVVGRVKTSGAISTLRVVADRLLVNSVNGTLSIWQPG